jgi:hypothetical protein
MQQRRFEVSDIHCQGCQQTMSDTLADAGFPVRRVVDGGGGDGGEGEGLTVLRESGPIEDPSRPAAARTVRPCEQRLRRSRPER